MLHQWNTNNIKNNQVKRRILFAANEAVTNIKEISFKLWIAILEKAVVDKMKESSIQYSSQKQKQKVDLQTPVQSHWIISLLVKLLPGFK